MFREVPVLPVVVPIAAATFAVVLWRLRRRGRLSAPTVAVAFVLCVYVAGVLAHTVFPIYLDMPASDTSWTGALNLEPLAGYEAADAATNVLVFVPLGMLIAFLAAAMSWRRAAGAVAACSLAIELVQLVSAHVLGGGHIADVNDLAFNVVGGLLGFGVGTALRRRRSG